LKRDIKGTITEIRTVRSRKMEKRRRQRGMKRSRRRIRDRR
jgi:hypothetical protein